MYVIFDIERTFDERVCRSEQDIRDTITGADLVPGHFIVVEFDTADGTSRDVTADFVTDEDDGDADDAFGIPAPDSLRRWHEGRVL